MYEEIYAELKKTEELENKFRGIEDADENEVESSATTLELTLEDGQVATILSALAGKKLELLDSLVSPLLDEEQSKLKDELVESLGLSIMLLGPEDEEE